MPNLKTTTMPKQNLSFSILKLTNFYNLMWIQGTAIKITITYYAFYNLKISINVLYASEISPKHNKANSVGVKTHSLFASVRTCHVMSLVLYLHKYYDQIFVSYRLSRKKKEG